MVPRISFVCANVRVRRESLSAIIDLFFLWILGRVPSRQKKAREPVTWRGQHRNQDLALTIDSSSARSGLPRILSGSNNTKVEGCVSSPRLYANLLWMSNEHFKLLTCYGRRPSEFDDLVSRNEFRFSALLRGRRADGGYCPYQKLRSH
jgi:hypothetical protein